MGGNFSKFKSKFKRIRILKAVFSALSAGSLLGGGFHLVSRLDLIPPEPWWAIAVGAGALIIAFILSYILLGKSDAAFARELDRNFSLNERVETMVEFKDDESFLATMQRKNADECLAAIPTKRYKAKRVWIYAVVLLLSAGLLCCSFLVENRREITEEEEVELFTLSPMQEAGMLELINNVKSSEMQEPYRTEIVTELERLLTVLRETDTVPKMRAALAETMAYILASTSDSSSSAEILNALWNNGNVYLKHFAKVLDTDAWASESDWGDFAEKLTDLIALVCGEGVEGIPTDEGELIERLAGILDGMSRNTSLALKSSGISDTDALYSVINKLVNSKQHTDGVRGIAQLAEMISDFSYEQASAATASTFDAMADEIFAVISELKTNTSVGESAMLKLSNLFLVPLPEFERPDFVKNREEISEDKPVGENDNERPPNDGGIGEGATFGSKDLVLDPLTGNYVEYGTLIDKYHAIIYEKIDSGSYTEAQKEAIKKYFSLLYGGLEKEEGN